MKIEQGNDKDTYLPADIPYQNLGSERVLKSGYCSLFLHQRAAFWC